MTDRLRCPGCGVPTIEDRHEAVTDEEATCAKCASEWSGSQDPADPDNYWIDDKTGERVNAWTGERTQGRA